jgi:hypothetical protein
MTDADQTTGAEAPPARTSRIRRALQWATLSAPIRAARELERKSALERGFVRRAAQVVRVADRVLDPPDGGERSPELALDLYRQAAYWLGRAARPTLPADAPLPELLSREASAPWVGLAEHGVLDVLNEPFWTRFDLAREQRLERAREAQASITRALDAALAHFAPVRELQMKRAIRLGPILAVALTVIAVLGFTVFNLIRGPDLAAGRPWRASSSLFECDRVAETCGNVHTRIFFHTREEESPWLEIDLGKIERISRVHVVNRSDESADRALPLLVEVSTDGTNFRTVAQRTAPFSQWTARFEPSDARLVRLRAARRTMLHLERVSVRR